MIYEVTGTVQAKVKVRVEAASPEDAWRIASDQWAYGDLDASEGSIDNANISEIAAGGDTDQA